MNKYNSFYLVAIILGIVLYMMYSRVQTDSVFFYGFAENKETEINHNKNVLIKKIFVTPGEEVKKGDLLMIVTDTNIPTKLNELQIRKEVVNSDVQFDIKEIQNKINELLTEQQTKSEGIKAEISLLKEKIAVNKSLFEGLESIEFNPDKYNSVEQLKIDNLNSNLIAVKHNYDERIKYQNELLDKIAHPSKLKKDIIDTEIDLYESEQENLSIYAPTDGLVGNILCKEREYISSFKTLLNFYRINPTLVKGYVHENLLLQVKLDDELSVSSSLHPEHQVNGKVIGLGSRIVEIPERLRKIPENKTYGREVLIRISPNNDFLQKEKVMLNALGNLGDRSWANTFLGR